MYYIFQYVSCTYWILVLSEMLPPKRVVNKSVRYQTTPSDEAPQQRTTATTKTVHNGDIEDDFQDIRSVLQKDAQCNNTTEECANTSSYGYIPSHMHAQPHMSVQTQQSHMSVPMQLQRNDETYACISQSSHIIQPALPLHYTMQPQDDTDGVYIEL